MVNEEIKNQGIYCFMDDLASKSPAPGGGSVAALTGALAASLVSMVCRLTIGKKKFADFEEEAKKILEDSEFLRKKMLDLAEEDKKAFLQVMADGYSKESLKKAMTVPNLVAELSEKILNLALRVVEKGNQNAITDAKMAVLLAKAAKEGALLNVEINQNLLT